MNKQHQINAELNNAELNNAQVHELLTKIHANSEQTLQKVEGMESRVMKKAIVAGALSGGTAGTVMTVGIELIKAKFGG